MSESSLPFGRTLTSGTYEITESFAFVAPVMESALKISEGATVTLNIAAGVEVVLRGGDAFEVWGAGAGIEVPADATLKVTGEGKLYAFGGKGANGCNGLNGGNGSADRSTGNFTSGAGGAGGWGGGGAGAGIGGKGASGGGGGNGGKSVTSYNWEHTDLSGQSGDNGGNGKNGGTCGTVSFEGKVMVFATGGVAGDMDGAGGAAGMKSWDEGTFYWFGAYGGGGGGGGEKGGAAADIGGGGAGGYGGGGGGSGGYVWGQWETVDEYSGWGAGGKGANDGFSNSGTYYGGSGGSKGAVGAAGGNGTLLIAITASVITAEQDYYNVGQISETEYIRWEHGHLYRVENGVRSELTYSVVNKDTTTLENGWYVVNGTISRDQIKASGTANLVLLHRASLVVSGSMSNGRLGVWIPKNQVLNIFGVESGSLTATGWALNAGIGGEGMVTINGGTVTAIGGESGAGIGGGKHGSGCTVTINGGVVTATGGSRAAGIGSGEWSDYRLPAINGGMVTINGGIVTATGGIAGAGIGGGHQGSGGVIIINGGEVMATGGKNGAGIGGGHWESSGMITIGGGVVTATGIDGGAGIGGGSNGSGDIITIIGGEVTATGGVNGSGIGGGYNCSDGTINLDEKVEVVEGAVGKDSVYVKIVEMECARVTIREFAHATAVWTSGDGSVMKEIGNDFFGSSDKSEKACSLAA